MCRRIYYIPGDVTDTSDATKSLLQPVHLFSKFNKTRFGYFDPEQIFSDNENKYFLT